MWRVGLRQAVPGVDGPEQANLCSGVVSRPTRLVGLAGLVLGSSRVLVEGQGSGLGPS